MPRFKQIDTSTNKDVFESTFTSFIIVGIVGCFLGWLFGITGAFTSYSNKEKEKLKLSGGRLGVGVSIGFFWGIAIGLGLLINGIRQNNMALWLPSVFIFPLSIILGIYCVKKYKSILKTIAN